MSRPQGYLIDLDGTLYSGGSAIPGAVAALQRLQAAHTPVRLVTNTTSRSRAMLVDRLAGFGFQIASEDVFTATLAGRAVATSAGYRCIAPFVPQAALEDLRGMELVGGTSDRPQGGRPEAVIVGDLAEKWSYALLQEAFEYLMSGAELIALSRDRYWMNQNRLALDAGPFVAALEFATDRKAVVAGKPSPSFYAAAVRSLGVEPASSVAMIGDDLWSDVEGAQRAGLQGWLVRTGKHRGSEAIGTSIRPDRILESIAELA
jgi:phospholysine phosphohistidine inorganic pyrophosphate phosphatase